MFQQLLPLLRQRSVLLTVTHVENDEIRVNLMPKKLADSENSALTTPMSFTGTAVELDARLPNAIVSFVASNFDLKNSLERAKEEMASAAKAAQDEARNKSTTAKKAAQADVPVKKDEHTTAWHFQVHPRDVVPLHTDFPTPYEYGVGREFHAVVADDRLTCGCR